MGEEGKAGATFNQNDYRPFRLRLSILVPPVEDVTGLVSKLVLETRNSFLSGIRLPASSFDISFYNDKPGFFSHHCLAFWNSFNHGEALRPDQ
jgi:hypothetical protein